MAPLIAVLRQPRQRRLQMSMDMARRTRPKTWSVKTQNWVLRNRPSRVGRQNYLVTLPVPFVQMFEQTLQSQRLHFGVHVSKRRYHSTMSLHSLTRTRCSKGNGNSNRENDRRKSTRL